MKRNLQFLSIIAGLGLLAACVPTTHQLMWKDGKTRQQRQSDFTSCEVMALKEVPRAQATTVTPSYTTPIYTTPTQTNCYGTGNFASCTTTGGQVMGGQTYGGQVVTFDPNSRLREQVALQCLAKRGYAPVTVPVCQKSEEVGVVSLLTGKSPKAAQVKCLTADKLGYVPS